VEGAAVPGDAHFFRIEGWRTGLIVSETMKVTMTRAGCFGAGLLSEGSVDDLGPLRDLLTPGDTSAQRVFLLRGTGWRGYVVAGGLSSNEDQGEFYDPSALIDEA
jgi:hypothetical protein